MATFVLVHGAWHGAWVWPRTARILRAAGHDVFTPTLTGVGERSHLAGKEINLSLHVLDVCNVLRWENLDDVVLCGHSYGGAVVTGVADALPDRIRALVYLDAFVPRDGESVWDYVEPKRAYFLDGAGRNAGRTDPISCEEFNVNPADRAWVKSKLVPMAIACFLERIRLTGAVDRLRRTYVLADGWSPSPFAQFHERARNDSAWTVRVVRTGHDVMIDDPEATARLLAEAAG